MIGAWARRPVHLPKISSRVLEGGHFRRANIKGIAAREGYDVRVSFQAALAVSVFSLCFASGSGAVGGGQGEWPTYGGDQASTKYSPLEQINSSNFEQLEAAWVWETVDNEIISRGDVRVRPNKFAATPLMIDGSVVHEHGV